MNCLTTIWSKESLVEHKLGLSIVTASKISCLKSQMLQTRKFHLSKLVLSNVRSSVILVRGLNPSRSLAFQDTTAEDFQIAFTRKLLKLENAKSVKSAKSKSDEMCKVNEAYQYLLRQRAAWESKAKLRMGWSPKIITKISFGPSEDSFIYSRAGSSLTCTTGYSQFHNACRAVFNHENKHIIQISR